MEGDRRVGSKTLPLTLGENRTRDLTSVLMILFLGSLLFCWYLFLKDLPTLLYILLGIGSPCIVGIALLYKGELNSRYRLASNCMKWTMLMGILFPIFALIMGPEKIYIP